jgi:predicted nuclease of predicted toxin-antitoxin system
MRWLIDNALSPELARLLNQSGHDAIHVTALNLGRASDRTLIAVADQDRRTLVSADADFGTLLALAAASSPSVLLFRGNAPRRPDSQHQMIMQNADRLIPMLLEGAIVVMLKDTIRVRSLPITRPQRE